jgi:hypothetical protein
LRRPWAFILRPTGFWRAPPAAPRSNPRKAATPSVPNPKFAASRGAARSEFRVRKHTSNHMNLAS